MQLSIRWKLIISIVLPMLIISSIVMSLTFDRLYSNAKQRLHGEATDMARHYAARLDAEFKTATQVARSTANFLNIHPDIAEEELYEILRQNVVQSPLIYGAAIAFEPYQFDKELKLFSPYVYRELSGNTKSKEIETKLLSLDIGIDSYDYSNGEWDWFSRPRELDKAIWTEPYFDEGAGNILMDTYSVPFYRDGKFRGIVTIDIPLDALQQNAGIEQLQKQPFVIVSPSGKFIAHPDSEMIMKGNIRQRADEIMDSAYSRVVDNILAGENGVAVIKGGIIANVVEQGPVWVFFAPIKSTGWSFATGVAESKMTEHVRSQLFLGAVSLCILIFLVICSILFVSNNLTDPIRKLAAAVKRIGEGELDCKATNINSTDEIGQLANGFNDMVCRLNHHVEALSKEMAARQLVENELSVAREIQASLLPRTFPPFPDHEEFDLYARNEAARHVAGDFYDFFFVNETTLMIVMADVSGKGIPAAMIMAVTRTIIRNLANTGKSPAEILEETNRLLIESRTQPMFVTIFLGCYDTNSGTLNYANAGHHPAYIINKEGAINSIGEATGTIVGMLDDAVYENDSVVLEPENYMVLYTDGIPEARSPGGEFYGDNAFTDLLSNYAGKQTKEICDHVINEITEYQAGELSDDITLMVLLRNN
ncbi:MAG TPA: HAMP domain-containing protein [Thiotrichaceae bacterium]|nr:HAMP domain-containing protein [Thiotrichaceae bacterium]